MRTTRPGAWQVLAFASLIAAQLALPVVAQAQAAASVITRFNGRAVPAISAQDRAGRPVRLSDLRGKVVIVNLWASWCGPCRAEMPSLERLAAQYPNDLVVLAISNDEHGWPAVDRFAEGRFLHLRMALAGGSDLPGRLGALGLPYSLIVDRQGHEIGRVLTGAEWDKGALAALVAKNLAR